MFHVVALDPDLGRRVITAHYSNASRARAAVDASRPDYRATAIDSDTGRTIAGPGRLGSPSGKTARRRALDEQSVRTRKIARLERRRKEREARAEKRLARRSALVASAKARADAAKAKEAAAKAKAEKKKRG